MKKFPNRHRAKQPQQPAPIAPPVGHSRVSSLKNKLTALQVRIQEAIGKGDIQTKAALDGEAALLRATILRAQALVTDLPRDDRQPGSW